MTTDLTIAAEAAIVHQAHVHTPVITDDKIDLLKRTICKGATNDELALFVSTANRLGLDPFARQIFAVKRKQKDGNDNWIEVMSIQVSIDGFRLTAQRSGAYAGQVGPHWCGEDGVWRDVWLAKQAPSAARVGVLRRGFAEPLYAVARFDAYAQTTSKGLNVMWSKMGDLMIAKCAEALALRRAFPAELSGVYSPEEMGQADNSTGIKPGFTEEQSVRATEQAKRRLLAADVKDELAPMFDAIEGREALEELLNGRGYEMHHMSPDVKTKLWKHVQAACVRTGLNHMDAKKIITNAPEYPDADLADEAAKVDRGDA